MKKLILLAIALFSGVLLFSAPLAYAEDVFNPACQGAAASSPVCQSGQNAGTDNPLVGPSGIITRVTQIVVLIVGIAAVIVIIISGLRYITSAGDAAGVNSAKNGILYAVVGLVIALAGQAIITFVLAKI